MRALINSAIVGALVTVVAVTGCLDSFVPLEEFQKAAGDSGTAPYDSAVNDSTVPPLDTTVRDSTELPPDTTVVDSTTAGDSTAFGPVVLLTPEPLAFIPQNDTTMGCTPHPYSGSGFQIHFTWGLSDNTLPVAAYHLYAKKESALYPIIDTWIQGTEYHFQACNAFVIDRNLSGWYWHVVALDSTATPVAVSETRWFAFLPCRLADGHACSAPGLIGPAAAQGVTIGAVRPRTGVESPPR